MRPAAWRRPLLGLLSAGLAFWLPPSPTTDRDAFAQCDVIPGITKEFRGALGTLDAPFAVPGDDGRRLTITIKNPNVTSNSQDCDVMSSGFSPVADDHIVTLLFKPPAGPQSAVVLTTNCSALDSDLETCRDQLSGGRVACVEVNKPPGLNELSVVEMEGIPALRFRFPDTDALVGDPNDGHGLTGPTAIAVTSIRTPLPCGLATARCAETPGLIACIDELYARDGSCENDADTAQLDPMFPHFTALPRANDYRTLCTTGELSSPCEPVVPDDRKLRFTIDSAGNALVPMNYAGVLVSSDSVPIPRLLVGDTAIAAFSGKAGSVEVPSRAFLGSYSLGGHRLPPIFEPLSGPASEPRLRLFGSVDAPVGVIRVKRRGCVGSATDGSTCTHDSECPGGSCEVLFDFSDRLIDGIGPVVISDADFELGTENPVPLEGLVESDEMFAFIASEAIDGEFLNDDSDATDPVIRLRDRKTASIQPIGSGGKAGRAVTRVRVGRFRFPSVAVEDDIVAFLEPEPLEGYRDANADGDVWDTLLRIYRVSNDCGAGTPCAEPLTASLDLAVESAPLLNGKNLVVSDGIVFFRTAEVDNARQVTTRISSGVGGSLSAAGDIVALRGGGRALVHDIETGVTRDCGSTSRNPSISADGGIVAFSTGSVCDVESGDVVHIGGGTFDPAISADGRFLATEGGPNGAKQIFVHDLETGETEAIPTPVDVEGNRFGAFTPSLSGDGRLVLFGLTVVTVSGSSGLFLHDRERGVSSHLVSGFFGSSVQTPAVLSADGRFIAMRLGGNVVRSLETGVTERVDISSEGTPANDVAYRSKLGISPEGRFVAFSSPADNLVPQGGAVCHEPLIRICLPGDPCPPAFGAIPCQNVFVHDRLTGFTRAVSIPPAGAPEIANFVAASLSASGQVVAFSRTPDFLFAEDPSASEVFVQRPDPADLGSDITGDGDHDDTVLQFIDTRSGSLEVISVGPAEGVAIAGGSAVFLSPEAASGTDLNGDGDADDLVVHSYRSRQDGLLANLEAAAEKVAVSEKWIAALRKEGEGVTDLNGDGDSNDLVVAVNAFEIATAGSWINVGQAADTIDVVGSVVAFLTPEAAQGLEDLNGDGDSDDRVLQVYRVNAGESGGIVNVGYPAEEFVLGENLVALRTPECAHGGPVVEGCPNGGTDLNGDGDAEDDVLLVYDLISDRLFNTAQPVIPCPLEACDPRVPYRVLGDTVTFITAECAQGGSNFIGCPAGGTDLNGDGDAADIVKQLFNASEARTAADGESLLVSRFGTALEAGECVTPIASASAGVCTQTGDACVADEDCNTPGAAPGTCFLPPGRCIANVGGACTCGDTGCSGCDPGQVCVAGISGAGSCHEDQGPCASQAQCANPAVCTDTRAGVHSLVAPLTRTSAGGAEVMTSAGTCVEIGGSCSSGDDCGPRETCSTTGTCERRHGTCQSDVDCDDGLRCAANLVIVGAADSDGDGIADPFDNCEHEPNTNQADVDGDGVGDRCDRSGPDADSDGWPDLLDNCTVIANDRQTDTNRDGFGNACDCDLNNDGFVDFLDIGILKSAFFTNPGDPGWNPDADLNVDGDVDFLDLGRCKSGFFQPPGPAASL